MAVVARKRAEGTTFYVVVAWQGKRVWERAGTDRREADRLERRRKAEIAAGTYVPPSESRATTLRQWAASWLDARENRTAADDRARLERHVLTRPWLADMAIDQVRPKHLVRLARELGDTTSDVTGKTLSPKTVAHVYGTLRTMFRDARIEERVTIDPCVLPRGTIARGKGVKREPYDVGEVRTLTTDERIPLATRVWIALAFYTGAREGEVCGLRWRDYDPATRPLGCLTVARQYDGRPLKTDQPRAVPVHPALAAVLDDWRRSGWHLVYRRPPTAEDFIVPQVVDPDAAHTKSSAYKAWRRACDATGVTNRSLHSTRHTFISLARRGGARKDVLERVTHNAAGGDVVDGYTTWDWAPLCEAVSAVRVDVLLTRTADSLVFQWRRRESNPGPKARRPYVYCA